MKDVSIIIVNYNSGDLISNCVNSIINHTHDVNYEIIVVDNNTDKELGEKLNNKYDINIKFISLPKNEGFGRANNAGFKIAEGKFLFCLNPDTLLLNNSIKILFDFMVHHSDAGACGGNLFDAKMAKTFSYRMTTPGLRWEINEAFSGRIDKFLYKQNRTHNNTGKPLKVAFISGADLMLRKDLVEKYGGFDNSLFMYYEDTEICRRLRKHGYNIYSVPDARIMHLEGQSSKEDNSLRPNNIERMVESRIQYLRITLNPVVRSFCNNLYTLTCAVRSLIVPNDLKRAKWRHTLHHHIQTLYKRNIK